MSDPDSVAYDEYSPRPGVHTPGTRRSGRIAARQPETAAEVIQRLNFQGITPSPSLEPSQIQALSHSLQTEAPQDHQTERLSPPHPGRKRARKTRHITPATRSDIAPDRRSMPQHAPPATAAPASDSSLHAIVETLRAIDARLQALESTAQANAIRNTHRLPAASLPSASAVRASPPQQYTLASALPSPLAGRPYVSLNANVSPRLRSNILSGKDVNLIGLILPSPHCDSKIACGENVTAVFRSADPRLSKDMTFGEFVVAFGIYRDIMCTMYPERRHELDTYLALIADLHINYGKRIFYQYHKAFASKAALHIAQSNTRLNWASLDTELLVLIAGGSQAISCFTCGDLGHSAPLCPRVPFQQPCGEQALSQPALNKTDSHGRKVITHNSRPICNNFNESVCTYPNCTFLHICSGCKDAHPKSVCPRRYRRSHSSGRKY